MDYNNSSRRIRPWGSRVMAFSIKCDSLALRTESREEWIFSSGINCMSVWEWLEWERKCSETVVGLDYTYSLGFFVCLFFFLKKIMQIPTGECCRSENPPLSNALQSPLEITNAIGRAMSKLTPKRQKKNLKMQIPIQWVELISSS